MLHTPVTLSLAMIVRDAEATLERALKVALPFCDELVVVDTGSTDQTIEIANQQGAKVFNFPWCDDFAVARNEAFLHCTGDWILWLDADDVIAPSQQLQFNLLKETVLSDQLDVVCCTYQTDFSPEGQAVAFCLRERFIRRAAGLRWEGAVHEYIADWAWRPFLWREDLAIEHRPLPSADSKRCDRNLRILENILAKGDRSPRNLFYYGNELRDHACHEAAIDIYKEYLRLAPDRWENYEAMINLVQSHQALGQLEAAVAWCYRAIELNCERAEAFNALGMLYVVQSHWKKAIPFFAAASVLQKPRAGFVSEDDYTWLPHYYLCLCHTMLGAFGEAERHAALAEAFAVIPKDAIGEMEKYIGRC